MGILVLLIAGALAVAAFSSKAPEVPDGAPPTPPGDGPTGGPLAFEPVLLGEPTLQVNPF